MIGISKKHNRKVTKVISNGDTGFSQKEREREIERITALQSHLITLEHLKVHFFSY